MSTKRESVNLQNIEPTEYSDSKLWFKKRGRHLYLGITHEGIEDLGAVSSLTKEDITADLATEDLLCTIKGENGTLELVSPCSGLFLRWNEDIFKDLKLLEDEPLNDGWVVCIEVNDESELKDYF